MEKQSKYARKGRETKYSPEYEAWRTAAKQGKADIAASATRTWAKKHGTTPATWKLAYPNG